MEKLKPDDFSFPSGHHISCGGEYPNGLTKREYFAGQALQGLLSNSVFEIYRKAVECGEEKECLVISGICFEYADAMIKEGDK